MCTHHKYLIEVKCIKENDCQIIKSWWSCDCPQITTHTETFNFVGFVTQCVYSSLTKTTISENIFADIFQPSQQFKCLNCTRKLREPSLCSKIKFDDEYKLPEIYENVYALFASSCSFITLYRSKIDSLAFCEHAEDDYVFYHAINSRKGKFGDAYLYNYYNTMDGLRKECEVENTHLNTTENEINNNNCTNHYNNEDNHHDGKKRDYAKLKNEIKKSVVNFTPKHLFIQLHKNCSRGKYIGKYQTEKCFLVSVNIVREHSIKLDKKNSNICKCVYSGLSTTTVVVKSFYCITCDQLCLPFEEYNRTQAEYNNEKNIATHMEYSFKWSNKNKCSSSDNEYDIIYIRSLCEKFQSLYDFNQEQTLNLSLTKRSDLLSIFEISKNDFDSFSHAIKFANDKSHLWNNKLCVYCSKRMQIKLCEDLLILVSLRLLKLLFSLSKKCAVTVKNIVKRSWASLIIAYYRTEFTISNTVLPTKNSYATFNLNEPSDETRSKYGATNDASYGIHNQSCNDLPPSKMCGGSYVNEKLKGGYVLEVKKGVHRNIIEFDFNSAYPSIIVGNNLGHETVFKISQRLFNSLSFDQLQSFMFLPITNSKNDHSEKSLQTSNDMKFDRDNHNIYCSEQVYLSFVNNYKSTLRKCIEKLINQKKCIELTIVNTKSVLLFSIQSSYIDCISSIKNKQQQNTFTVNWKSSSSSPKVPHFMVANYLHLKQKLIKKILTGGCGIIASEKISSFLQCSNVANIITTIGRLNLHSLENYFSKNHIFNNMRLITSVIYGDTDSVFISIDTKDSNKELDLNKLSKYMLQHIHRYFQLQPNAQNVNVVVKNIYEFFLINRKKRYICIKKFNDNSLSYVADSGNKSSRSNNNSLSCSSSSSSRGASYNDSQNIINYSSSSSCRISFDDIVIDNDVFHKQFLVENEVYKCIKIVGISRNISQQFYDFLRYFIFKCLQIYFETTKSNTNRHLLNISNIIDMLAKIVAFKSFNLTDFGRKQVDVNSKREKMTITLFNLNDYFRICKVVDLNNIEQMSNENKVTLAVHSEYIFASVERKPLLYDCFHILFNCNEKDIDKNIIEFHEKVYNHQRKIFTEKHFLQLQKTHNIHMNMATIKHIFLFVGNQHTLSCCCDEASFTIVKRCSPLTIIDMFINTSVNRLKCISVPSEMIFLKKLRNDYLTRNIYYLNDKIVNLNIGNLNIFNQFQKKMSSTLSEPVLKPTLQICYRKNDIYFSLPISAVPYHCELSCKQSDIEALMCLQCFIFPDLIEQQKHVIIKCLEKNRENNFLYVLHTMLGSYLMKGKNIIATTTT